MEVVTKKDKTKIVNPGQLFVVGMIRSIDKFQLKNGEVRYRNRVLVKTADEYGYPMPVDIVSEAPLGDVQSIFEGVVEIMTYPSDYNTRPDENGEIRKIKKVELTCYFKG